MKQQYISKKFTNSVLLLIDTIDGIVDEYQNQGFMLTVRQLYYQLVARAIIPNTLQEYKRVAGIINDAKLAGLIDWDAIEDRTREFVRRQRWDSPQAILKAASDSFHQDQWVGQQQRPFVIVEKEALVGVLEPACKAYDVPLLAARGYPSGTVLREFVREDILPAMADGQTPIILHLGDHDPSGIDMSRDIEERVRMFVEDFGHFELQRIALTMAQIKKHRPPPNPAKSTDARFADYAATYGTQSWELDALPPTVLDQLVRDEITLCIGDKDTWNDRADEISKTKTKIAQLGSKFK